MDEKFTFTPEEREQTLTILERLRTAVGNTFSAQDEKLMEILRPHGDLFEILSRFQRAIIA